MPLFSGAPKIQIYHTDLSPKAVFTSRLTEVFRIRLGAGGNEFAVVRDTWFNFVAGLERSLPTLPSLSGSSLNLDQHLFLGIIGWEGTEVSNQGVRMIKKWTLADPERYESILTWRKKLRNLSRGSKASKQLTRSLYLSPLCNM